VTHFFKNIHKGLLKAYAHIPAELEQEKKRKEALKNKGSSK
jgi:hypothetical protein